LQGSTVEILSGRVAIVPRDGLGQSVSVAAFAQLIGAPVEKMAEVVPGEVIAEIGQLSGRPDLSVIDARAVGDVEASASCAHSAVKKNHGQASCRTDLVVSDVQDTRVNLLQCAE
jgi:hypothetical protein